jgi:hypothetical protein
VLLILAVAGCALALAWPLGLRHLDSAGRGAALYGGALAVLNAIVSHWLVLWSDRRSTKAFLRAVLWGMAGRLGGLLLAVAAGILLLDLPPLPLTASLLFLFVAFLTMELATLHRRKVELPGIGR